MKTTIRLLSFTHEPRLTLYAIWQASRTEEPIPPLWDLQTEYFRDPIFQKEVDNLVASLIDSGLPCLEAIHCTFLLENVPVSLREQMVRHRIGHNFGDRIGADIIPDLTNSSWWSQGFRILDCSTFSDDNRFFIPETIAREHRVHYKRFMNTIQEFYKQLVASGVPLEDARQVLPFATQHRLSWTTNLISLKHLLAHRGCWIVQLGMWKPIILGMVNLLAEHIHPNIRKWVAPPCVKNGVYDHCIYGIENARRINGEDPFPPCSLYLSREAPEAVRVNSPKWLIGANEEGISWSGPPDQMERYKEMQKEFSDLWGFSATKGP